MKLDKTYSTIHVCPETKESVSQDEAKWGKSGCSQCGDIKSGLFGTHAVQIPGRWNRPTFIEGMFKGKKMEFLRKEDEDKTWETLKND